MTVRNLVVIFGDQLSPEMSSLRRADSSLDRVLMVEVKDEASYVRHHPKKIAFIFSAMRHFAQELTDLGWTVEYVRLTDAGNTGSFSGEVGRACSRLRPMRVIVTEPGEWRVLDGILKWEGDFGCEVEILEDTRFLCSRSEFARWADGRKLFRMEHFYREMRRKTGLLMEGPEPVGERWNFDSDNRKPAKADLFMPRPERFEPDRVTREVLDLVSAEFPDNFGSLEPFWFAVTRAQANAAFDRFLEQSLARFGDYQDAMLSGEKFLYHAVISAYLNVGLLDPLDVCRKVEQAYVKGEAPLNAVEGFIRQIIGWREYVRGIYWLEMPDYGAVNFLEADGGLPEFYWTGETKIRCLHEAIVQTRDEAYAHHIQRLMITGNFALLIGVDPRLIHEWYLSVYVDAFEWVELPNTIGMSQFADGGLLGSKPYVSGGNYINRMSDYCADCHFDVNKKFGPMACPFNYLYWDFVDRNREKLKNNNRLRQVYSTWGRMNEDSREKILESAKRFHAELKSAGG